MQPVTPFPIRREGKGKERVKEINIDHNASACINSTGWFRN